MTWRRFALSLGPLLAILIYLPTIGHGFVFDDRAIIGHNPLLEDVRSLPRLAISPYWSLPHHRGSLYRPLTMITFAVDRLAAGGLRPAWFHLVNVLLHALATFLVVRLALEVAPAPWSAAVAGALFAVHPIHVETVAALVGRSELLAACGALLAVLLHIRSLQSDGGTRARRLAVASWAASALGMLAKESAAVIPLLCAAADLALVRGSRPGRARLYAGQAVALGLYLSARFAVLGGLGVGETIPFIDNPAASTGALDGRLTALSVVPRYAWLLLWPRRLSADYSYDQIPLIHSVADPAAILGFALVAILLGGGLALLRRAPAAGFPLMFVAISASLTLNLVVFIGTLMAERLMYLPSAGICLLFGALAWSGVRHGHGRIAAATAVLLCCAAAGRTWTRLPDWKDDFALYRSAAMVSPRSARIRFNLGNAYLDRQDYAEAVGNYRAALGIYSEFEDARVNLGMALLQEGRAREGLDLLRAAADRAPANAELAVNVGTAYKALGDLPRAVEEFRRALALDPSSAKAWNNLGSIALARGEIDAAIVDLREATRREPGFAMFHINLADALVAAGRQQEAALEFDAAASLDPDLPEAHRGRGEAALWRGDRETARHEFGLAETGRPPSARAANFLGYLEASRGDAGAAAMHYERAVQADPGLADAHRSLGLLYIRRLGKPAEGARHLERSLTLDPGQAGADDLRRLLRTVNRSGR